MIAANIFSGLVLLLWTLLLRVGFSIIQGVVDQHVPGYPAAGQTHFWIGLPTTMLAVILVAVIVCNFIRRLPGPLALIAAASLLPLPLYIFSGGGV